MGGVLRIAASIGTPLALAGFTVGVLYLVYRLVLTRQLSRVLPEHTFRLLSTVTRYVFVLALVALVLGISAYVAVTIFPPSVSAAALHVEQEARQHLATGYYEEALKESTELTKLRPQFGTAFRLKGNAHFKLMEYSSALQAFQRALDLEPNSTVTLFNKGAVLTVMGDYAGAREIFKKLLDIDPNDMSIRYNLAEAYLLSGDHVVAAENYKVVYRSGGARKARAALGLGLAEVLGAHSLDPGRPYFREAVCLDPKLRGVFAGTLRVDSEGTYEPYISLLRTFRGWPNYDPLVRELEGGNVCS